MDNSRKNFIWNLIGLTLNAFISLFLLIIVNRYNGIDEAGVFTYAFSLCSLFQMMCLFFTRTFQVSDYERKFSFNDYFLTRVIFSSISIILVVIFSFISGFNLFKISVILLLILFRTVEALADLLYGQMQIEGNLYKTGISYSMKAILGVLVFILIDMYTNNLLFSILGLLLVYCFFLFSYDKSSLEIEFPKLKLDKSKVKKLVLIALPVFIYTFLQNYLNGAQKIVMTYFVTNDIQTVFGIIIMPATMIVLIGNYIIMPFINDLTNKFKNKDFKAFDKTTDKICISLFIIGIICIVIAYYIGVPVLNFLYSMDLSNYKMMLIVILIGAIFNAITMVLANILTVMTINKKQTYLYLIVSIISTIISIIGAKYYGINGLCYSYLGSYILLFILYYIVYKYQIKNVK